MLTVLAPLVESHDNVEMHSLPSGSVNLEIVSTPAHGHKDHDLTGGDFFAGNLTAIHPKHFDIRWIRVYKNPERVPLKDLNVTGKYTNAPGTKNLNHVIFPPGFEAKVDSTRGRRARLFPSLWRDYKKILDSPSGMEAVDVDYFWVKIDPTSGELEEDKSKPGNSGLVTATENNTVIPGDIVAIAINVKLTYYRAVKEPTDQQARWTNTDTPRTGPFAGPVMSGFPGSKNLLPLVRTGEEGPWAPDPGVIWARDYNHPEWTRHNPGAAVQEFLDWIAGGSIVAAVGIPHVGILNPNYPLEQLDGTGTIGLGNIDSAVTHEEWGHKGQDGYHTIVYQFEVTKDHSKLNDLLGGWLAGDGTTVNPFNVPYRTRGHNFYQWANFDTVTYPHGRTYAEIKGVRNSGRADHDLEFGFAVPFGATTYITGKRLRDFLDVSDFLANAPYVAYPESSAVDNDPGLDDAAVATDPQQIKKYAAGDGETLKRVQYRHHADSFNSDENTYFNNNNLVSVATHGFTNFDGVYKRAENYPFYIERKHLDRNNDGILDYLPVIDNQVDGGGENQRTANGRVQHYSVSRGFYEQKGTEFPHLFPPTYNGRIHYPKVVTGYVAATPKLDVPSGTQTGTFTVTLRFQEDYSDFQTAPVHGEDALATLQAALAANVENGTVTGLSRLGVVDDATQYQVTLVPALGVVGELTLHVPAGTVVARTSGLGNSAATFTVPIDTSLQLVSGQEVEDVEPEGGAYLAGSPITVKVPFEQDGLTYEGANPPYVTIYLGDVKVAANARHATWQQGAEQSGSTVVPFVYVLQASDPPAGEVNVPVNPQSSVPDVSIPKDTVLMSASGLEDVGTASPAVAAGEPAPVSETPSKWITFDVPVTPVIYLPPDDAVSKAVASTVPRSPIVFNELGNGSGDTNDWLEFRNVSGSDVSLKDWELSVVADGKKEDTSLIIFPDVSVPANGLLLITNSASDKTPLAGGENKGLSHASLVDAGLSLPDDGKFLLILRNATEKLGLDEAFIDVAGGGGSDTDAFIRDETGDYDTHVWPLQVLEAPGDATEDALSSGKVWQRAKSDIIGYHQDAWAEAAFTGIGYDRNVSKSAATAGTPGYPNGALKTEAATPKGAVTISEIMFDSEGGTLPQWIELYNKSKTEALNLNRWKLEIQNRNSPDLVGRPIVTLTLQEKVIQPNQTLLIVAGTARASSADVFPEDRVYNLFKLHEKNLRIKTPRDTFLSGEGFYLKLSDRNGTKIDEVGNIDDNRRTDDAPVWVWPTNLLGRARSSVVRRYDKGAVARDGMVKSGWALAANFNQFKVESLHYGHADDIGTPGYRQGGALPVELSSFAVSRTDAGPVVITWTTESEVDNAGFNLRRSLKRDSGFTLLNPVLIAGAGTTGERQTYTFTDTSAKHGIEYYYQIEEISLDGRPETLRTRYLPGPVSPANRSLTTFGEVKQRE